MTKAMRERLILLRDRQVADLLNVTTRTVYGWTDKGLLKAIRVAHTTRFRAKDIERFIKRHTGLPARKRGGRPVRGRRPAHA
jgi:excisionase family DNA binding protein